MSIIFVSHNSHGCQLIWKFIPKKDYSISIGECDLIGIITDHLVTTLILTPVKSVLQLEFYSKIVTFNDWGISKSEINSWRWCLRRNRFMLTTIYQRRNHHKHKYKMETISIQFNNQLDKMWNDEKCLLNQFIVTRFINFNSKLEFMHSQCYWERRSCVDADRDWDMEKSDSENLCAFRNEIDCFIVHFLEASLIRWLSMNSWCNYKLLRIILFIAISLGTCSWSVFFSLLFLPFFPFIECYCWWCLSCRKEDAADGSW